MTQKELLYIEDALGHEANMKAAVKGFSTQLKDKELKKFVSDLSAKHEECFTKFYSLLS